MIAFKAVAQINCEVGAAFGMRRIRPGDWDSTILVCHFVITKLSAAGYYEATRRVIMAWVSK